jgi:hypothetical protein
MGALRSADIKGELVAARDAAGWMNDDRVAYRVALGIERLLHDERTLLLPPGKHAPVPAALERERELGFPGGSHRLGQAHRKIIPPAGA